MLAAIVRASLAHPRIVSALGVLFAALGALALATVRFDVFPDFAPPHVLVQTESPGLDAGQVEALVTRPLEGLLAGTENVKSVRSTSSQGLSAIQVVFERGGDPYLRRQIVTERLAEASGLLPAGVQAPQLSPLSSSMEYLLHVGFTSRTLTPLELRDIVQWTVKPQILAVAGVAQAQLFGGDVRERQVVVDPARLAAANLALDEIVTAIERATRVIGGGYLETATQRIVLRSEATGASVAAMAAAVVADRDGVPLRLGDVATIVDAAAPRFGGAMINGEPGILVETSTQFGANTLDVSRALEARLEALAPTLAKQGVDYHPALLRPASFIETAIAKLRNSLLIGAALVVCLLLATLRDWRGALVSFGSIPLALLTTVWLLDSVGLSLNTMTIGGLVVALGVVVDDAVIDVENILRRRRLAADGVDVRDLFRAASLEVRRPVFYATLGVGVAFVPILLMSGIQGAFFRPLSIAFLLAVFISLIVAMSVTPAACAIVMRRHRPRSEARFLGVLKRWQLAAIARLHDRPRLVWALLIATGAAGVGVLPLLGARLLPDFREDYLIAHASLRPGISIEETVRVGARISKRLAAIPGVAGVAEQIGRAENGQDPDTPNKGEFEIRIAPSAARDAKSIETAIRDVFDDFPNQLVEIYSVLAERIGETLSGESAPFVVSVFGPDLDADDKAAEEIAEIVEKLPDASGVRLIVPPRETELRVRLRPDALAFHGVRAADALAVINAAFHGSAVGAITQADRSVPVVLRIAGADATPRSVGELMLRATAGARVPLSDVADLDLVSERSQVSHQDGLRRQVVVATPKTTDQAGFARVARLAIAAEVQLPLGVYLDYGGSAAEQAAAARELLLHSAAALAMVVLLLAIAFGSARHVLLTLLALPSTLLGGGIAVWLTGGTLTIGAMVGFVALFGMAARNTILLVSHFDHLVLTEGAPWNLTTALRGAEERLTPVLLTALLTALALLPVALSVHEAGHEIEAPMAIVILGGLVTSTLVSLLLIPPLAARWLRIRPIPTVPRANPRVSPDTALSSED